jgi:hypothetical protein
MEMSSLHGGVAEGVEFIYFYSKTSKKATPVTFYVKMHQSFLSKHFILVGYILLRYLYMLYKHTTQKLYICDPQTQLNNFFYSSKNVTTCFGLYGPSSGDIFEDFLLYCDTSIVFKSVRLSIAS